MACRLHQHIGARQIQRFFGIVRSRNHVKRLVPLSERYIQACRRSAERSDPADKPDLISVFLKNVLKIAESAVNRRVSECQIDDIFPLFKVLLQKLCPLAVFLCELCPVSDHRHENRDQGLLCDFRHCPERDLISDRILRSFSRNSNDLVIPDQACRLERHQLRISRADTYTICYSSHHKSFPL